MSWILTKSQRAVTKDVDHNPRWGFSGSWWVDKRVPFEVAMHHTVCQPTPNGGNAPSPFILNYRGFQVQDALRTYRITMDYAEGGDLFGFMEKFVLDERHPVGTTYRDADHPKIPCAFAWKLFDALVQAAIHIHVHDIVHRDIKLNNVFFTAETGDEMGGWKVKPVLADFGMALPVECQINGVTNPIDFRRAVEDSNINLAPEEYALDEPLLPHAKIDEKTTVFALGYMLVLLVSPRFVSY